MVKETLEAWLYSIRKTLREDIVINLLVTDRDISFLSAHSNKQKIESDEPDTAQAQQTINELKGGLGYIG